MKIRKLFQKTQFGIFGLFGLVVVSTSALTIYTVQTHLSAEYESNSRNIAKTIADASVDILLNRNLATLQSLIDQFVEIQGIRYVYITSDNGEFLAHTFVPGIPEVILNSDPDETKAVNRRLPGMGEFVEVGSPILAGFAGTVHVGMDLDVIGLKIQRAIGQQVYLISILLVVGILASIWFINLAAKPLGELVAFAVELAKEEDADGTEHEKILARDDEAGEAGAPAPAYLRAPAALRRAAPGGGKRPVTAGPRCRRWAYTESPSRSSAPCCRYASGRSTPGASFRPCWCTSPAGPTRRRPGPSASRSSLSAPPRPGRARRWDGWDPDGSLSPAA